MTRSLLHVVGARPNFMKAAPVMAALSVGYPAVDQRLVHTGQHYDERMAGVFFDELGLRPPDESLGVGSGTHAEQTARVMVAIEPVLTSRAPDCVVVYGDVNSTMAAAITAVKLGIPVAHVEAGLRSFDTTMPEETNRVITDHIARILLTPSVDADANLRAEGIASDRIRMVGNVMIDSLMRLLPLARNRRHPQLDLDSPHVLVTLHRPSNVDDSATLMTIVDQLILIAKRIPIIFPVHPRTLGRLEHRADQLEASGIRVIEPLGYLDFIAVQERSSLVVTDSGGVQEETTVLGVPCLTVRPNTERPITISHGTNQLVDPANLSDAAADALHAPRTRRLPDLWDGHAGERIAKILATML